MDNFKELKTAGQLVLFTPDPLSPADVPEGLFYYDITKDEQGNPAYIVNSASTDYYGSILAKKSFCLEEGEAVPVRCYEWYFTGRELTINEF